MNIFFVNNDAKLCAQELPDTYTGSKSKGGKMIIESCQMLANAYPSLESAPLTQMGEVRKHSYLHHPCSKWVLSSVKHFQWLLEHALAMIEEKQFRGGKLHFSSCFLEWCIHNPPNLLDNGWRDPPMCMPEKYYSDDCRMSYQAYIRNEKPHLLYWTGRQAPKWYLI